MQIRRTVSRALATVATLGLFAVSGSAQAAGDYYLKFDGPAIEGESTRQGHEKWIEIDSFSWGVSIPYSVGGGGPGGGGAGKPSFQDFSWTQYVDKSVLGLFKAAGAGTTIDKATIDFTTPVGKGENAVYFQMVFDQVVLTSVSLGGSSGNVPTLQGSFAYGVIEMAYWTLDPAGKTRLVGREKFDLSNDKESPATMAAMFALGASGPQFEVTPVPEPETYGMLLAGLGLMGVIARRRSRQQPA